MNQATICAFPSLFGASPLVGLEVLTSGRAIVATPLGFDEFITNRKNGALLPLRDGAALEEAIKTLKVRPALRKKKCEEAALQTEEHFEWERITTQYHGIYPNAVSKALPRQKRSYYA